MMDANIVSTLYGMHVLIYMIDVLDKIFSSSLSKTLVATKVTIIDVCVVVGNVVPR